jgi:TusA-related sulfurtransferase
MPEARVIDGRGMEPPEPLELAVAELATLPAGGELVLLLNCEPYPLYAILDRRGYRHRSERQPDGSNRIHIKKA